MTKRLVDIQDELLDEAREVLGTSTIKDTVTTALEHAVRNGRRRARVDDKAMRRFAEAAHDLSDDEVMRAAWH